MKKSTWSTLVSGIAATAFAASFLAAPGLAHAATTTGAAQLHSATAMLVNGANSKDARPGQAVSAKLTSKVDVKGQTALPKGTMLFGTVAHVKASSGNGPSSMSIVFNKAKLRSGKTVPIKATLLGAYPGAANGYGSGSDAMYFQAGVVSSHEQIDQEAGALSHVAMHSAVQSPVSAVFTSKDRNINLEHGMQLQVAIAPQKG